MFAKIKQLALISLLAVTLLFGVAGGNLLAQESEWPSVGVTAELDSVILPGTELEGRALFDDAPMVVQVKNVFAHGDSFRYDLSYQGFEPGEHDLSKWLVRKDGSSTDDLPKIPVKIRSVLPPGQQKPNDIESTELPSMGGYTLLAKIAVVAWVLGLLGLIFIGRARKKKSKQEETEVSLADLLKDRLAAAEKGEMTSGQYAELERMLFSMWRRRLGLEDIAAAEAVQKIRENEKAGPLMRQMETWIHSPNRDTNLDLSELLNPYRDIPASELESPGGGK